MKEPHEKIACRKCNIVMDVKYDYTYMCVGKRYVILQCPYCRYVTKRLVQRDMDGNEIWTVGKITRYERRVNDEMSIQLRLLSGSEVTPETIARVRKRCEDIVDEYMNKRDGDNDEV